MWGSGMVVRIGLSLRDTIEDVEGDGGVRDGEGCSGDGNEREVRRVGGIGGGGMIGARAACSSGNVRRLNVERAGPRSAGSSCLNEARLIFTSNC